MLVTLVWLVVRGRVWQTLLQGKASYRDVFLTLNEGYLLNNLLPFRLGEVGRAYLLGRKAKLDFWQVLPSVVLERMFDLIMAAALLILHPALCRRGELGGAGCGRSRVGWSALGLLGVYLVARNQPRVTAWLERLGGRWPWVQKLVGERLETFFAGLQVLTDLRLFLRALAWILFNWAFSILLYFVFLRAFFPQATAAVGGVRAGGRLVWGRCAFLAGGGGRVRGGAGRRAGGLLKVDPSPATAFAITLHLSNYINTGLIGGYALLREGETLASLYSRLGRLKEKG